MRLQQQTTGDRQLMRKKARLYTLGLPINEPATDPDEGKFTVQAEDVIDDYYTEEFLSDDVLDDAVSTFVMFSIWIRDYLEAPTTEELFEPEAACRKICERSIRQLNLCKMRWIGKTV